MGCPAAVEHTLAQTLGCPNTPIIAANASKHPKNSVTVPGPEILANQVKASTFLAKIQ